MLYFFFFFNDTATTEIYTLSLHDALPICGFRQPEFTQLDVEMAFVEEDDVIELIEGLMARVFEDRSEEHTSELQSRQYLVCRLLLEKKQQIEDSHVRPYLVRSLTSLQ